MIESMVLVLHLGGFFGVLIPLWVLAPRNSSSVVFTQFENLGGWPTQGLSFMVGLLTSVYGLLGADSAVHMSEEIRDASIVLPKATMWSIVVNGAFGWVMVITLAFTAGNPLYIVDSKTGYPFIQAFYNATGSKAGTSVMVGIMIINITSSVISTLATVSRQLWSFGRDRGLPCSSFLAHVRLSFCHPDMKQTNNNGIGQTWLEHSVQRCHRHILLHITSIFDQHWEHCSIQRHLVDGHKCSADHLHHLDRLRRHPKTPWATTARKTVEHGTSGSHCELDRARLLVVYLGIPFLPSGDARHSE